MSSNSSAGHPHSTSLQSPDLSAHSAGFFFNNLRSFRWNVRVRHELGRVNRVAKEDTACDRFMSVVLFGLVFLDVTTSKHTEVRPGGYCTGFLFSCMLPRIATEKQHWNTDRSLKRLALWNRCWHWNVHNAGSWRCCSIRFLFLSDLNVQSKINRTCLICYLGRWMLRMTRVESLIGQNIKTFL